jgi:LPS-assembly protein
MRFNRTLTTVAYAVLMAIAASAQQTNPVERQVANPIADTANINPVSAAKTVVSKPKPKMSFEPEGGDGEVVVYSDSQTVEEINGKRLVRHSGNVDVRYGIYRLQADEILIDESTGNISATGSVVFDQGDEQRITGVRATWNYRTRLGSFEDSTGFTDQSSDGTTIFFRADRVERVSLDEVVVINGMFTACEESVPKWSFSAESARIKRNDRIRLKGARFKLRDVTVAAVPFASIPITKRARSSGFLTPTGGYSARKGLRISGAYYQTLGDSADVTIRGDIFTSRGIGYGLDLRTRANSRSFFNAGFYAVKDRIFGKKADEQNPDQGGSLIYADGVHYFPNGFTAAVDVRLTSSLAFRQEFSDGIQQVISPIEVSQVFVNKSWDDYTLNLLSRSQVISIPNVREKTRNLPSINFEKRPSMLKFLDGIYFSFKTSLEGVSRREEVDDIDLYRQRTGHDPVVTPALSQRLDVFPQLSIPISTRYVNFTASAAGRITYYSDSFNDMRQVVGRDVLRKYGEFTFDVRPVALARNFYGQKDRFRFRHVIEPLLTYRLVKGINNFNKIIRFDEVDTVSNTNEIEYGVINRIYVRRFSEAVSEESKRQLASEIDSNNSDVRIQPYEVFTLSVRGKYFFDRNFGGALIPGRRNQLEPITAVSFYTFGGVPRRFSPLNIEAIYRPRNEFEISTRADVGLNGDGIRAVSSTIHYKNGSVNLFQTFYYTRAVTLIPSLAKYADENGKEPGTLRGSQWSPSLFLGDRNRGLYGGASLFFDFQNRRQSRTSPLISSLYTLGYASNCCAVAVQYYTFNVGLRRENRFVFSFRLNGIGTFGTEQFGQGLK